MILNEDILGLSQGKVPYFPQGELQNIQQVRFTVQTPAGAKYLLPGGEHSRRSRWGTPPSTQRQSERPESRSPGSAPDALQVIYII